MRFESTLRLQNSRIRRNQLRRQQGLPEEIYYDEDD